MFLSVSKRVNLQRVSEFAGLDHLHSMVPPLIHKGFKTSNVLVDENFIAKVSDAGVDRLLGGLQDAGGFSTSVYQDPE